MSVTEPTLHLERELLRAHTVIVACDEVGRGALAGPVAVGAVVLDAAAARGRIPDGLRDSKLVPERRRDDLAERAVAWVAASTVGWATAAEIDEIGIMAALGAAAGRAIGALAGPGSVWHEDAVVLLDGNYDYITPAGCTLPVRVQVKADRDCAAVAAASVIAKTTRDSRMRRLHEDLPVYDWTHNKGYASPAHRQAIAAHGLSPYHRSSWAIGRGASARAAAPTLL